MSRELRQSIRAPTLCRDYFRGGATAPDDPFAAGETTIMNPLFLAAQQSQQTVPESAQPALLAHVDATSQPLKLHARSVSEPSIAGPAPRRLTDMVADVMHWPRRDVCRLSPARWSCIRSQTWRRRPLPNTAGACRTRSTGRCTTTRRDSRTGPIRPPTSERCARCACR